MLPLLNVVNGYGELDSQVEKEEISPSWCCTWLATGIISWEYACHTLGITQGQGDWGPRCDRRSRLWTWHPSSLHMWVVITLYICPSPRMYELYLHAHASLHHLTRTSLTASQPLSWDKKNCNFIFQKVMITLFLNVVVEWEPSNCDICILSMKILFTFEYKSSQD